MKGWAKAREHVWPIQPPVEQPRLADGTSQKGAVAIRMATVVAATNQNIKFRLDSGVGWGGGRDSGYKGKASKQSCYHFLQVPTPAHSH